MRRLVIIPIAWLLLGSLFMGAAPISASEDDRLAALATTPTHSSTLPEAILESAKIQYRRGRWSEFFGLAAYARLVFPKAPAARRLMVLEAMALLRHCQFDRARAALAASPADAEASAEWKRARRLVDDWLELSKDAHLDEKPEDRTAKPKPIFDSTVLWPISHEAAELRRLSPFGMRRTIEPLCPVGGTP